MCRAHEIWQVKRTHTATLETTGLCRQTQGSGGDRAAPRNSKSRGSLRDGSQFTHFHQDEFTGTVGKKGMSPGGGGGAGQGAAAGTERLEIAPGELRARPVSRAVGGALTVLSCPFSSRSQEPKGMEGEAVISISQC